MSSVDDDIDYMSEDFLASCVGNNDVRPGLLYSHATKRKHDLDKKKKASDEDHRKKMKPIHEIQEEKLKEGLKTPLDASNKGFAMLQKMGYKSGMSLGKQGTGIVEPVSVNVKSDRIGLGWQQLLAQKRKRLEERKKSKRVEMNPAEYRAHMSNQHAQKLNEGDLRKSRKVCYELDFKEGYTEPPEYWFWPEHTWEIDSEEGEYDHEECEENEAEDCSKSKFAASSKSTSKDLGDSLETSEQLQILTSYLRSTHLYCVWCCTEYEDTEDLEKHCPGLTRSDHD